MVAERGQSTANSAVSFIGSFSIDSKPIKFRNACNQCFAGKVRCEGNKAGCQRCLDRDLACIYSVSKVGKVVGKRRKRLANNAVRWEIPNYVQSPANTLSFDESTNLMRKNPWESVLDLSEQPAQNTEACQESFFWSSPETSSFASREASTVTSIGSSTRSCSPSQELYPSLMPAGSWNGSRLTKTEYLTSQSSTPPKSATARFETEPQFYDEEEMVCIRLLGHLKKHSRHENQSTESIINLIQKSNAAVRRILTSRTATTNYNCVILLSVITTKIVDLCEQSCMRHLADRQSEALQFLTLLDQQQCAAPEQIYPTVGGQSEYSESISQYRLRASLENTANLSAKLGDLLRWTPLDGFQTMGRHECLHLDLEKRLMAMGTLLH